ncbi:MAG: DUF370 domain-containing protein [Oscillospiraceae bacterium]|nr:DUF370 domain-containing protein [Oscillospiraceae bacterium]
MYIHLGGETTVRDCDIIGIFDIENTSVGKITREYLSASEKRKAAVNVYYDMPKSFVVSTRDGRERIFISPIAPATLIKRCNKYL